MREFGASSAGPGWACGRADRGPEATIRTDELLYDPEADRISSDKPTEINQRGNVIRGRGVVSDTALRDIRITSGSAVLRSDPERQEREAGDRAPSRAIPAPDDST